MLFRVQLAFDERAEVYVAIKILPKKKYNLKDLIKESAIYGTLGLISKQQDQEYEENQEKYLILFYFIIK